MLGTSKFSSLATGLVERARSAIEPAIERVETIRYDAPPIRLSHGLLALVVIAAAWLVSIWWVKHERDVWWRERIAASSPKVRATIGEGSAAAEATDEDVIKGLQNVEDARKEAERELAAFKSRTPAEPGDPCRVPARCLGGIGGGVGLRQ